MAIEQLDILIAWLPCSVFVHCCAHPPGATSGVCATGILGVVFLP